MTLLDSTARPKGGHNWSLWLFYLMMKGELIAGLVSENENFIFQIVTIFFPFFQFKRYNGISIHFLIREIVQNDELRIGSGLIRHFMVKESDFGELSEKF